MLTKIEDVRIDVGPSDLGSDYREVSLAVEVSENTPFYDRPADYDPIAHLAFRAQLVGAGRDGDPALNPGVHLAHFGYQFETRELRCRRDFFQPRAPFDCEIVPVTRTVREIRFLQQESPSDNERVLRRGITMTVERSLLDVDEAVVTIFGGHVVVDPRADLIFARVQLIDRSDGDRELADGRSNVERDFFEPPHLL